MEKDASISDQPKGTRRSERPRKTPSRFNEDTEPPKSTKKKVSKEEHLEGTSSKPLLISDWTDVQIASYCDLCGITFIDYVNEYINHIRMVEQSLAIFVEGHAKASK